MQYQRKNLACFLSIPEFTSQFIIISNSSSNRNFDLLARLNLHFLPTTRVSRGTRRLKRVLDDEITKGITRTVRRETRIITVLSRNRFLDRKMVEIGRGKKQSRAKLLLFLSACRSGTYLYLSWQRVWS